MKKILSLAAVATMALTANAAKSPYQDKNYKDWGKLKLVNNQLSSSTGDPVQLKGWSTFSLHYGEVQGCLGAGQWSAMKTYGANVVRLAMYIDEANSYLSNPSKFKETIKTSIAECKDLDMYVLVDWHVLETNGHSGNPNDHLNEAKDFFGEISKYCKDNGYDHVLYELCNEPTCGWANIKTYAESVIPVITANQPDAIIVVGTDQWCQKIMEPVSNPIKSDYKKNVMYSFHYYSCSHYSLLGDFRNAQKNIPVFVSEWSAVKFDGNGPFCSSNADQMIAACDNIDVAPQVVSWCIWNWGKKNEASSFYTGTCAPGNESQYKGDNGAVYGDYVRELMAGEVREVELPETGPYTTINVIPTTESNAWHWDYYDLGGEGVAYHDGNGGAWAKDDSMKIVDYANAGEEVDVFSLAQKMQWLDFPCPWSKVENGKVTWFDDAISTGDNWKDADKKSTYKSLNGGRTYSGTDGSARPDEGVDLSGCNAANTPYANSGYCNLGWVEEDEWINYTVKVAKPGYYKIAAVVGGGYKALGTEISIVSDRGNLLRNPSSLTNDMAVNAFGFDKASCSADVKSWDCWMMKDAKSGRAKEVYCAFGEAGTQGITIRFTGDAGDVGPLTFEFIKDIDPADPVLKPAEVSEAKASEYFTIYPNPTSGEFTVALAEDVEATVEVVNVAGQVVASQKIEGTGTINKALAAGVYSVVVKSNGAVKTQKLIVK
ncbi:MAG: cellulase family glycosylhydrolase [Bacteroidales bacterium]|nr:cellulase family glycosylhydrolase [Candidatus Scybalocola fimicaballi]